ncbi:MAG: CRISPR-associated protein Cas4 [Alicyclobacillus sp.]|nr:CRISPR-associated protein Cas4 [Alicyclobacillus sp.]
MEDELFIPISALQHYVYCPRQCALIHLEQTFLENADTLKGRWQHARVDSEQVLSARGYPVYTSFPVWSESLGLTGKCDAIEWRDGVPFPVEFKRGPRRRALHDDIQLAAQALCLEEMLGIPVRIGAIFHIQSHRRRYIEIDETLRQQVKDIAQAVRTLLQQSTLPPALNNHRCTRCSLQPVCLPQITHPQRNRPTWWRVWQHMDSTSTSYTVEEVPRS